MNPPLVKTTATWPVSARDGVLMPGNPRITSKATRETCKQDFIMTFSPKGLGADSQSTGIFRKFSEHGEQNAGHCVCAGLAFFAHSIRAIAAARLLFPPAARLFDLSQRLLRP